MLLCYLLKMVHGYRKVQHLHFSETLGVWMQAGNGIDTEDQKQLGVFSYQPETFFHYLLQWSLSAFLRNITGREALSENWTDSLQPQALYSHIAGTHMRMLLLSTAVQIALNHESPTKKKIRAKQQLTLL